MREHRKYFKKIGSWLFVFIFAIISSGIFLTYPARAALADCGTAGSPNNTAQNSLTVTPSHGAAFYIDSSANQQMDSQYIAYRISSSLNYQSLWVSVDNFSTGSVISLVNPADSPYPIDSIVGGAASPTTVYFLLKASSSSNAPQKHDFKIYQGKPNGQSALFACTFTFTKVRETIKANPNKVDSVAISTTSPNIGGTFQVTVVGNTGTIGAGSSPDNDSIWLSPAPQSSWPTRAIRLERVDLLLDNNNTAANDTCGSGNSCYTDQLIVNSLRNLAVSLGNSNTNKLYYVAKYTFRVIGRAPAFVFKPIAQISSGTQMKHTPITSSGAATTSIDLSTVDTKLLITAKAVTSPTSTTLTTKVVNGITYMKVDYKITVRNSGTSSAKIDALQDTPSTDVIIDSATATTLKTYTSFPTGGTETVISPAPTVPTLSSGSYTFTTPITIVAGGRAELTYTMLVPQCASGTKTYVNYVVAKIGGTSFGSASAGFAPDASLQFTCGTNSLTTTGSGSTTRIPFEVNTNPATSVTNTTATINGSVNSNGVSGKAITFEYWSNPNSVSTVTASPSTTTTSTDLLFVTYDLTGLTQGTKYYFRVLSDGVYGSTLTFVTTEPIATPTVTTDAPSAVTTTDATLNGTVDPNQTAVYFAYEVYTSRSGYGTSTTPYEYRIFDDLTTTYNSSTNPYTQFAGSFPYQVPINMNNANLNSQSSANATATRSLDTLIRSGDTVYYRSKILYVSNTSTTITGDWKSFALQNYLNQTISWNSISDIQWGAAAPTLNPSATSGMTVSISLDPSSTGCAYSGGVLTITQVGVCTLLADQAGGLKSGTSNYYNAADQVSASFQILPNEVTVTADAKSKNYGADDPSLTYTTNFTVGSLKSGDAFTGSLTRDAGGNVGTYAIKQGTLDLGSNYVITFVSANLTINTRPITVTASATSKTYGDSDPASFAYTITTGSLVGSDMFSGALSRASGENVGTYTINKNTLSLSSNYTLTYVAADFTISTRPITFKADSFTKQQGASDPTFTYSITSGSLAYSDTATASISRASGESASATAYVITIDTVTISPSNSNYSITKQTGGLTISNKTIPLLTWNTPAAITYGETLTAISQLNATLSSGGSSVPATCTYTPDVGTLLTVGTKNLSVTCVPTDSTTYESVSGSVTIVVNAKQITVTADEQTKVYGASDPTLTYVVTCASLPCLVGSDSFTGSLTHALETDGSENATQYDILIGSLALTSNYTVTYVSKKITVTKKSLTLSVTAENKIYDGNTNATVTAGSLSGILDRDLGNVNFAGSISGVFVNKNVGTAKTVTLTATTTLSGSASGNYSLNIPSNPTANITKKSLQITANDVTVSVGNSLGSISYTVNSGDLVGGDSSSVVTGITCTSDYVVGDAAGTSRSTSCSGGSSDNYSLTYTSGVVTITAASTYSVTYSDNVDNETITVPTDSTNYSDGASVTISSTEPSRTGYSFNGWTTDSGNSGTLYKSSGANSSTTISSANITFYAKWTVNASSGSSSGGNSPAPSPVVTPSTPKIISISASETCAVEGQLTIFGTDLAGATVSVDGLPAIVNSSNGNSLILTLPTYYVGVRTLTVTNSAGSASTTVKYVLVDRPVYQNFIYPQMFKGQEFSYTFTATNADKYSLSGIMPIGLTLNQLTGELSGTPGVDGTFFFTIVASNVCGVTYLKVYMFVDKEIPSAFTCNVQFNIPRSDNITPAKLDALKNCLGKINTLTPTSIDPVIFISGGIPYGLTPEQSLAHPRYKQIVDLIKTLGLSVQIYVGAFIGSADTVQLNVYWPEPS